MNALPQSGLVHPRSISADAGRGRSLRSVGQPASRARDVRTARLAALTLAVVDAVCLILPALVVPRLTPALTVAALLSVAAYAQAGYYRPRLHLSVLDEIPSLLGRGLAALTIAATTLSVLHRLEVEARFLVVGLLGLGCQLLGRALAYKGMRSARRRGLTRARTVVLGGGTVAADLATTLAAHAEYGLLPVGYLDTTPALGGVAALPHLGRPADLLEVIDAHAVGVLLVAFGTARESMMIDVMRAKTMRQVDVLVVPRLYEVAGGHRGDHIGAIPVLRLRRPALHGAARVTKRAFDLLCSAAALTLMSPVLLACAIAVRIEGGPGVIFRQQRVGKNGVLFELYKFRSLRPETGESEVRWNISQDHRLGPVGRFLRRTSLDELPQLWNIFRGDMTFVGPRPERPYFVDQFSAQIPRYHHRHRVPVGLTGLAQVSGLRGDTSIEHRARYDNYYIENWSLWLDIKVMLRTVREVLGARGG